MTWYAIRTAPGAQKPQREYKLELNTLDKDGKPRGKGYHIVPSLNPRVSAVERALTDAGFTHYMPAEKRLVRDRRHTDLWKPRRFALLVGYVFVKGPLDGILDVPGVSDIVGPLDRPMPIDITDILIMRSMEAVSEEQFDKDALKAHRILKGKAKADPRLKKILNKLDAIGVGNVPINSLIAA